MSACLGAFHLPDTSHYPYQPSVRSRLMRCLLSTEASLSPCGLAALLPIWRAGALAKLQVLTSAAAKDLQQTHITSSPVLVWC